MSDYKLELYYFNECPFCQMVLQPLKQMNIKFDHKNINENRDNAEKLFKDTGRYTVPCLYINGEPMHESRDIINWLQENQESLPKN